MLVSEILEATEHEDLINQYIAQADEIKQRMKDGGNQYELYRELTNVQSRIRFYQKKDGVFVSQAEKRGPKWGHANWPDEHEPYTKDQHKIARQPSKDFNQPTDDREQSVGADAIDPMYDPEREYHDDPTVDIGMDELGKIKAKYRKRLRKR